MDHSHIPRRSILLFFAEFFFGFVLIAGTIFGLDRLGIFDTRSSDHNEQRWLSLESIKDSVDVDLLILGNSQAYTGILPKQLSASTGMTSFVLANNGIIMRDAYWNLKEALSLCSPQLILIETSLMNSQETHADLPSVLVSSIRALRARPNFDRNWESTLDLFEFDNLMYALSPTLLNHHLVMDNPEMIKKNILMKKHVVAPSPQRLFLGQYAKFSSGISSQALALYDSLGAVIGPEQITISKENERYAKRIVELAKSKGIQVAFAALPRYKQHFETDLDLARSQLLEELLEPLEVPFFDLQQMAISDGPEWFQETRHYNQHMTLRGSMFATNILAKAINQEFPDLKRPGKDGNRKWHSLFESEEGYLSFFSAKESNPSVRFLLKNVKTSGIFVDELVVFKDCNHFRKKLDVFVKIDPRENENKGLEIGLVQLAIDVIDSAGNSSTKVLELGYDKLLQQDDLWIFRTVTDEIKIQGVKGLRMKKVQRSGRK
jgi:hypothetical protein